MAAYLIQLQARSGWTSIVRELSDDEAALLRSVAEELTRHIGFDGVEMLVKPVADCDAADLEDVASWFGGSATARLVAELRKPGRCSCSPTNDEGAADAPAAPSDQNPGRN